MASDGRRGRPRKFSTPSRAVTITLPENVIETLTSAEPDLGRAIVRIAAAAGLTSSKPAELSHFGDHAVILVRPTVSLEQRAGVELVPLPDGRALISFAQSTTTADLELLLEDAVDDGTLSTEDRQVFTSILSLIRDARRSSDVMVLQRNIIVLEKKRSAAKKTNQTVTSRKRRNLL